MTSPRESLQSLKALIETNAQIEETNTRVTPIYGDENKCVARILSDVEDKTVVLEVTVRKLCLYDGLKIAT